MLRIALCVGLFFTGALSLTGGLDGRHGYTLAKRSELAAAQIALADMPPGSLIAVEPEFNHPVILLGYPVVCGYEGHLWSHGLPYRERLAALRRVLQKQPGWLETAAHLKAKAIYLRGEPPQVIRVP